MILRADHVASAAFVLLGIAVIALSGDLPVGTLSFPGSGFMPKIVAALAILFGLVVGLRGGESAALATIGWREVAHAGLVAGGAMAIVIGWSLLGLENAGIVALIVALAVHVYARRGFDHASLVVAITAAAIYAYGRLGFLITITLLIFSLLVVVERRNVLRAALYAIVVASLTYAGFEWALKAPLTIGPLGF